MLKKMTLLAALILLSGFGAAWALDRESGPVTITGTLVGDDGRPKSGEPVSIARIRDNRVELEFESDSVRNPTTRSDAYGRFALVVPGAYLPAGQRFALVGSLLEKLVQEKGDTVFTFKGSSNGFLEIGKIRVR